MIWHEYKGEDIDKILNLNSSDFNKWVCETLSEKHVNTECKLGLIYLNGKRNDN